MAGAVCPPGKVRCDFYARAVVFVSGLQNWGKTMFKGFRDSVSIGFLPLVLLRSAFSPHALSQAAAPATFLFSPTVISSLVNL